MVFSIIIVGGCVGTEETAMDGDRVDKLNVDPIDGEKVSAIDGD